MWTDEGYGSYAYYALRSLLGGQIQELLSTIGRRKAFDLVKDRGTGKSKEHGFCVLYMQKPSSLDLTVLILCTKRGRGESRLRMQQRIV